MLVSAAGISSAETLQAPILTFGRVATAIATNSAARHRRLAARADHAAHGARAGGAPPAAAEGGPRLRGLLQGRRQAGFDDALRACLDYDFRDRLPEVKVPTLIVWGEKDSIIPVRDADEFERLIDDSRKVVMKDTGHIPMAERPQAFNDLLVEFLAETGRGGGEGSRPTASRRRPEARASP